VEGVVEKLNKFVTSNHIFSRTMNPIYIPFEPKYSLELMEQNKIQYVFFIFLF